MARPLLLRLLVLGLIPIAALGATAALVRVGMAVWATEDGGPTYRVEHSRVVDDLDAIQQRLDFEIIEPPHELVPWPLWEVRGSTSRVAYWYRSDEGLAFEVSQQGIDRPGSERGELTVNGTDVHRVVNEEFHSILLHWVGCDLVKFEVSTGLDAEDAALAVVEAMVQRCPEQPAA